MRKVLTLILITTFLALLFPSAVMAQSTPPEVLSFTNDTVEKLTLIATAAAVFFLVRAGYLYITSSGNPQALEAAKKTIRNTLIGLTLVIAAGVVTSVFQKALEPNPISGEQEAIEIAAIEPLEPTNGLTQVLIDAVTGFIQNLVESSTEPIVNAVLSFLTTTPSVYENQTIRHFWLLSVGITDGLFVILVALMGLNLMSASTFGFEEVEVKTLLPKLALAFLGANVSLYLADYAILLSNTLVQAVLNATGGLNHAFVEHAFSASAMLSGSTPLIILLFLVLFLIVSIVLLLLYISRLIFISLGAVLSPFIFLLSVLPRFKDAASIALKAYLVTVFIVFVHVVVIQLAGSFLSMPEQSGNSLVSLAVGIGLFLTLIKTPQMMMQMAFYTTGAGALKQVGSQIINVITTDTSSAATRISDRTEAAKISSKVGKL